MGLTSSRLSSMTWSYTQPSSGTSRCENSSDSAAMSVKEDHYKSV